MVCKPKNMRLIFAPRESNWNYFLDGNNMVYSIAKKNTGAQDCIFGNVKYFTRWIETFYGEQAERFLTALGFEVTGINVKPRR